MKQIISTLTLLLIALTLSAQKANPPTPTVNVIDTTARYRIYPTENMWTFLKLDTRTGRIWQVQWAMEDEKRFETVLSSLSLPWKEEEINGRYVLYPTTNIYNFIMLDQIDGIVYQVQWSFKPDNRGIMRISF